MPINDPRPRVACPACTGRVVIHPTTNRIPDHRERNEKQAKPCRFSGDYLPGFVSERPIRERRRAAA